MLMYLVGFLGYFLKKYGFSRAALLVAFVLTNTAEMQFDIVHRAYGPEVFLRPAFIILILLTMFIMFWSYSKAKKGWEKQAGAPRGESIFLIAVLVVSISYLVQAIMLSEGDISQLFPIIVSMVSIILVIRLLVNNTLSYRREGFERGPEEEPELKRLKKETLFQIGGLAAAIYILGIGLGGFLFALYFNRRKGKGWLLSLVYGIILGVLGHWIPVMIGYLPYKGFVINLIT